MFFEVIGSGFLLTAAWLSWKSVGAIVRGLRSQTWPAARGKVKTAQDVKKYNSKGREVWRQKIEYSYSVGAASYRGRRIQFGVPNALRWNDPAHPSFRLFRRKEVIDVFYNPSRPSIAALQRGYSPFVFVSLAISAFFGWIGYSLLTLPG